MGGLELALQKPEKEMWIRTEPGKGTWQGDWEPELRAQRLQGKETKKGRCGELARIGRKQLRSLQTQ